MSGNSEFRTEVYLIILFKALLAYLKEDRLAKFDRKLENLRILSRFFNRECIYAITESFISHKTPPAKPYTNGMKNCNKQQ